jgi:hypothetical protein
MPEKRNGRVAQVLRSKYLANISQGTITSQHVTPENVFRVSHRSSTERGAVRTINPKTNEMRRSRSDQGWPRGRKYCVPFTGWRRRRRSSCKSSLRSTKSISVVSTTKRFEAE